MAGTNDFQPVAAAAGANVLTQTEYLALAATLIANGFQSGIVPSNQMNKVLRQATFAAAALGQLIANANINATDDGNVANFVTNLLAAISSQGITQAAGDNNNNLATTAFVMRALGNFPSQQSFNTTTFTVTPQMAGQWLEFWGAANCTATLPLTGTLINPVNHFVFTNTSSSNLTLVVSGSDTFVGGPGTSVIIPPGCNVSIGAVQSGGQWVITGGSAAFQYEQVYSLTPGQNDVTKKIATTEFVKYALGNMQYFNSTNAASSALTIGEAGTCFSYYGTGAGTVSLPSTGIFNGATFRFDCTSTGTLTINAPTGVIYYNTGNASSITVQTGENLTLVSDGSNWICVGGSALLRYTAQEGYTPAQFDNSTLLATTAFVQQASGNFTAYQNVTGAIPQSYLGGALQIIGNVTLPTGNPALFAGKALTLFNSGPGTYSVTVGNTSTDFIYWYGGGDSTSTKTFTLGPGDTATLLCRGGVEWDLIGGSLAMINAGVFALPVWTTPPLADDSAKFATSAFVQANALCAAARSASTVTGSRAIGTVYTNTTGHPLLVQVEVTLAAAANNGVRLYVNSSEVSCFYTPVAAAVTGTLFGIVPPGGTYEVTNAAGANTLSVWTEY